tara:strand:- start:166 stop:387 length:222 start_codon:yes stop_codon:yes gene_type:complete
MLKINYLIIFLFLLTHCSIDTKTGLWKDKNFIIDKKQNTEISFDKELSFEEFKENVVLYGKKSNYPNLMINND